MRILLFSCLLFALLPAGLRAQHDSTYIEHFPNRARINGGIRWRERTAAVRTPMGEEFKLEKTALALRLGGRYGRLSYTFSFPVYRPAAGQEDEQSKSFGLGITLYMRRQLLSGSFRNTRGFRLTTPEGETDFRPDVDLFNINLFGYHVLNHKRFSLRAGFRQRDRQLKSAGSLLLGGLVDHQRVSAEDGLEVPVAADQRRFITQLRQTKFGIGAGYGHTLVFGRRKRFFFTPTVILGPEFRFVNYEALELDGRERERLHVSARLRALVGVGWNGDRTAVGLTGIYQPALDASDNLETRFTNHAVELRVTRRILFPK